MQSLQTVPLENYCSKVTLSKLNNGLDFSSVYAVNSKKCSGFMQELTSELRFLLRFFFFFLQKKKKKIGQYITKSENLFTALAIHCPSSQFHLAQVAYYPILLLQDRKKLANLSSNCVPRIFLDSRMWKHLAQSKKKQQISKNNLETSNKWFPSLQRNILPEESLIEGLNMFSNCPAKQ